MLMIQIELAVFLAFFGAAFGSFVDALVWRIRTKRNFLTDRSQCEHCNHKLGPLDLIPIASWLILKGKCRYCKAPITWLAPVTEVVMAALFTLSYLFWPFGLDAWQGIALLVLWLAYLVAFGVLVVYDARWMRLPDKIVKPLIAIAFIDAALRVSLQPGASVVSYIMYAGLGMAVLAGTYGLLYAASRGRLVGFGDVKLGVFMGVVLGWQKALLVLMLSNVIAFFMVLPGLLSGKLTRKSCVPFGPFLIAAFIIAGLFGDKIINWYLSYLGF